jgi:hypothetical protein
MRGDNPRAITSTISFRSVRMSAGGIEWPEFCTECKQIAETAAAAGDGWVWNPPMPPRGMSGVAAASVARGYLSISGCVVQPHSAATDPPEGGGGGGDPCEGSSPKERGGDGCDHDGTGSDLDLPWIDEVDPGEAPPTQTQRPTLEPPRTQPSEQMTASHAPAAAASLKELQPLLEPVVFEYHVLYSPSYKVPVLCVMESV